MKSGYHTPESYLIKIVQEKSVAVSGQLENMNRTKDTWDD